MYNNENDIKVTDEAKDEIKTSGESMEMTALTHDAAPKQC